MICVSGQSKSRPVKAAGAESCGQRGNQKLHAAVAKSTFGSENVQNRFEALFEVMMSKTGTSTCVSQKHFLKFWRGKNGTPLWREAHLQVNMLKDWGFGPGPLFEDPMWKNCTRLWREVHFQVKLYKIPVFWHTFWSSDVEKLVS